MTGRFALFADCLLAGVLVAFLAIPVVTAYPAFAAACSLLRSGEPIGPLVFLRRVRFAAAADPRSLWLLPLALLVLGLDALAIASGVPGANVLAVLLFLASCAACAAALRVASVWPLPPASRRMPLHAAALACVRDPGGSALLLLAAFAAVAIVLLVPVTALLVAGPLALASVAVERRNHAARVADV